MLTVIRQEGQLVAACEWWLVNQEGIQDWTSTGEWVRVEWLEIGYRQSSKQILMQIIDNIALRAPGAVGAFWKGSDDPKRALMVFTRQRLVAQTHKGGVNV